MALIDVSDLLLDPDFINNVSLIHRTTVVNSFGKNELTETTFNTFGSVQPAPVKEIQRLPESLRMSDVRKFWIKAEILSDGDSQYPDIILFQGKRFQVINTEPWLNYGAGWNAGLCVWEKVSG
jgi:hypothetical protein